MREGATYRNAISGSFPAVTASTHATIGTGRLPPHARDHRAQRSAGRRPGEGMGRGREHRPVLPPRTHPRRPLDRVDGGPGVGRRDRLPGVARRDARPRRAPDGRCARSACTGTRTAAAGGTPTTPSSTASRTTTPGLERLDELSAGYEPPAPSPVRPHRQEGDVLLPAGRALPGRADPRDVRLRADRAGRGRRPPLPELQGARLRGARLQHGRPAPGRGARRRRRTRSAARRPARRAVRGRPRAC